MQALPINAEALKGLRVFVVEDESLVAMQLEDMLEDAGCELIGLAMRVNRALEMLEGDPAIDVAILDVNIGGDKVYPVAERLRGLGVALIFATGYGRAGVEDEWQDSQILQKPYTWAEVEKTMLAAIAK